ncbi:MCE family protein [Mycobacterium spongiae]|uniref:MCE family protein n=1 Tax=Mycobacterium spongiae TaxID=886343 RepID=A0A975JUK3_9MYCO|nr:MCE family protein [Mycobacterium spongiae]QUR65931.1 MCE family protein [Mycobacterium spongiae]
MTTPGKLNKPRVPPYKTAGVGLVLVLALVVGLVYLQFRGDFTSKTQLTMLSARAGLVMDPGAKVTYNGVEIGRVDTISEITRDGEPAAKFILDVNPKYMHLIPANVNADIKATTVFGGKYVSLTTPENPTKQRITPKIPIDARSVTTEINTLFETLTSLAEQVDPVKLNLTLSAAAEALAGLGDKFGQSIVNANTVLDEVNARMPQSRRDIQQLAALADVYSDASPDLFDFLDNTVTTARTINRQQADLDAVLLAAAGFGNVTGDVLDRGGPYLQRGAADLVPTANLLDTYSPELYCTIKGFYDTDPLAAAATGGANGYSLRSHSELLSGLGISLGSPLALATQGGALIGGLIAGLIFPPISLGLTAAAAIPGLAGGAPNPYTYPENLPRVAAHGGPGGAPGCWQPITHDLWPAPYLVMDTGVSLAPYNHLEVGSPWAIEYVWGRQVGDNTINP